MIDNTKNRDADKVCFSVRLGAVVRKDKPGLYEVYCPVLDICTQGDTITEAKKNIAEAVELFMETCYEKGTLDRVLLDSGFGVYDPKKPKRKKRARKLVGQWDKHFRFSAKVAFAAV